MSATAQRRTTTRSVALPAEHGGWGFLLEPLLLGLLLAPSWAGLAIAFATVSLFLARQPLKVLILDYRRKRRFNRTAAAERFSALYLMLALAGAVCAFWLAGAQVFLPALVALPFAAIMLFYDAQSNSRHWLPELSGPVALSASASMIAHAGGWALLPALGLMLLLATRALPSIVYVRARLRIAKNKPASRHLAVGAHLVGALFALIFALSGQWPWLTAGMHLILIGRMFYSLYVQRPDIPAKVIGFQELGLGILMVVLTALGFHLNL
ncbi:MAG: hypothetical protein Kow0077_07140 [Anaerolineae bacterium]